MMGVEGNICLDEWHPESMRAATIITRFFIGLSFDKMFVFGNRVKARTPFDELKRFNHSITIEVWRGIAVAYDALDGRVLG